MCFYLFFFLILFFSFVCISQSIYRFLSVVKENSHFWFNAYSFLDLSSIFNHFPTQICVGFVKMNCHFERFLVQFFFSFLLWYKTKIWNVASLMYDLHRFLLCKREIRRKKNNNFSVELFCFVTTWFSSVQFSLVQKNKYSQRYILNRILSHLFCIKANTHYTYIYKLFVILFWKRFDICRPFKQPTTFSDKWKSITIWVFFYIYIYLWKQLVFLSSK